MSLYLFENFEYNAYFLQDGAAPATDENDNETKSVGSGEMKPAFNEGGVEQVNQQCCTGGAKTCQIL